jgi:hypothetical protein
MRRHILGFIVSAVAVVGLLAPGYALAQDGDEKTSVEDMRARVKKDADTGVAVHRPDGWVFGDAGRGVVALLTAAGDSRSQIEVRASKHVKKGNKKPFFASFHANIQKSGFEKVETRTATTYGEKTGEEIEYETGRDDKAFRLVVWQIHRGETAYLVVGFFPKEARSIHYKDFQAVCEKLEIPDQK